MIFIMAWLIPQLKEIKALKKLARDLTNEKCALMQKTEKDEAIISRMSQEALAKEDELARLQASLEAWQLGRPDAFIMNGATVPSIKGKIKPETSFDDCGEAIDILIEVLYLHCWFLSSSLFLF